MKIIEKSLGQSAFNWGKKIRKEDDPDINSGNFVEHFRDNPDEEMDFIIEADKKIMYIQQSQKKAG